MLQPTTTMLQQYLPFTVLKPNGPATAIVSPFLLQQYLPFTVLKPTISRRL